MIYLKTRTEFSFGLAFGRYKDCLIGKDAQAITDINSTFGHWKWQKLCDKKDIKPILGVELGVYESFESKSRYPNNFVTLLAKNVKGLKQIYEILTKATDDFFYQPRTHIDTIIDVGELENVIVLSGVNPNLLAMRNIPNFYVEVSPSSNQRIINLAKEMDLPFVATCENRLARVEQKNVYQIAFKAEIKPVAQWLLSDDEWRCWTDHLDVNQDECLSNTYLVADLCDARIPMAENVKPKTDTNLFQLCIQGAKKKGIDLTDPIYKDRMDYELKMIQQKNFEDYFLLVSDMISYAKSIMAVGAGRGSSAGSLVCYLCDITEIDPIPDGLLFERFMSPERLDPPDIDTDFEDSKRDKVHTYLVKKYGEDCVAKIGTVTFFKPKNALIDASKVLKISLNEISETKDNVIERSPGDKRASLCLLDTLEQTEVGKSLVEKYPEIMEVAKMEGHARHSGQHAAGILVTEHPITNYCAINMRTGAVMMDKVDVEEVGMLKIDALGLRTLTVIQDTLNQVDKDMNWLTSQPRDNQKVFDIFNQKRFDGIFQWEGGALQQLTTQTKLSHFDELVAITSLARPASLASGGAQQWVDRNNGEAVEYVAECFKPFVEETKGVLVYQEQVLTACHELAGMEWEDISALRKAIGKSKGREAIKQFEDKFVNGCVKKGVDKEEAIDIFEYFVTFGEYGFNKSHAVCYALLSYQTALLKALFPLEFFVATLRHAKDKDQTIAILRELIKEGYEYEAFNKEYSEITWTVFDGKIYGGLINIKGVAVKTARDIFSKQKRGESLTARQANQVNQAITPFDDVFERKTLWSHVLDDPKHFNVLSKITNIGDIDGKSNGTFLFLAKISERNQTDANDSKRMERRGGKKVGGATKVLDLIVEDDTGKIKGQINRFEFSKLADKITEKDIDSYYLLKGNVGGGFVFFHIDRMIKLTGNERYDSNHDVGEKSVA